MKKNHTPADVYRLTEGDGDVIVSGFDSNDRVLTDFNSYSDVVRLGRISDGQTFDDFTGLTHYSVSAVDANADGVMDLRIDVNEDSITLLGVSYLDSWQLMGG